MTEPAHRYTGVCHCGAIKMTLAFSRPAEEMQVRSCQCAFCLRQASLTTSDPTGTALIEVEAAHFAPYRFGTKTAVSLICTRCATYAGILYQEAGKIWSVANVRGLGIADFAERTGVQMYFERESADERIARRKQKWTPSEIRFKL